ncbi:hypothetical protein SASPL_148210 [Salvia splendens]|uniref:Peroxidase n=1 Tax=Salvia splendens TaxID=180675 RepID=A0A8X8W9B3_SALSN|nr:hypothetical protein SASPL_148210 [Salvia splendens]
MNTQNLCLLFLVFLLLFMNISQGQLEIGFYSQTCPDAESIVKSVVSEATLEDPTMPPALLRLHFHDCFVEVRFRDFTFCMYKFIFEKVACDKGCDGSILIEDGADSERRAFGHEGVRGFEQIEKAKQKIETQCPGVVSCADIVAMAARDAVALAGGPKYAAESGRRDGRVSSLELASDMPDVNDSIETLKSKFKNKGLSNQELVLLSGAHTIGTTACFFMPKRLYEFNGTNDSDPRISPRFLPELRRMCPKNGDINARIPMDPVTKDKFDDQIMRNIKKEHQMLDYTMIV